MPWFTKQRKKKAKNASKVRISDVSASFNAYFGLFRPYRSPTNTIWYGWYDLILAESARFGTNRSRFGVNRAASAQIEPSWRESEKKKKKTQTRHWRAGNHVERGCGTLPVASMLSRVPCFQGAQLRQVIHCQLQISPFYTARAAITNKPEKRLQKKKKKKMLSPKTKRIFRSVLKNKRIIHLGLKPRNHIVVVNTQIKIENLTRKGQVKGSLFREKSKKPKGTLDYTITRPSQHSYTWKLERIPSKKKSFPSRVKYHKKEYSRNL